MMLRWTVPVEKGNEILADGSLGRLIESLIKQLNAEAAYLYPESGERAGMIFFDMKESADIARIAEQLFQQADAAVEFVPVMNAEDLRKAISSL